MTKRPTVVQVDRLELSLVPKPWAFAEQRHADIDAFFAYLKRKKPSVWNGRVLLLHHQALCDGVFHGEFFETDFASFAAWRAWGYPPAAVHDCFAAGAVVSSDGAVLLGLMGEHTANAGCIYFPAGTPDLSDVVDGKVDFAASVARELKEETGCDIAEFAIEPGWTSIRDGAVIAQIQTLRSAQTADALRARMLAHLAQEEQPELSDIRIVRGSRDFEPGMLPFVKAFLEHHFAKG